MPKCLAGLLPDCQVYNLGMFLKLAEIKSPDLSIYGSAESGGGLRFL